MEARDETMASLPIETVRIKQEILPDDHPGVIKSEIIDYETENQIILSQVPKVEVKTEVVDDTDTTQSLEIKEVKVADYFIKNSDLVNIKKEENDIDELKTELLNDECDLPELKDEDEGVVDYEVNQPGSSKQPLEVGNDVKKGGRKKTKFPCPVCKRSFGVSKSRNKHFNFHFNKLIVICTCGKFYTKKNEFLKHHTNHRVKFCQKIEINYDCNVCSQVFSSKNAYDAHCQTHVEKMKYECNFCFKIFQTRQVLEYHLTFHAPKNKHLCEICSERFARQKNLILHLKNAHKGEKPFKCEICSKKFATKATLCYHMNLHTVKKSLECDICFKSFSRKASLTRHKNETCNLAAFKCQICFKLFRKKYRFECHLKLHGDIFQCPISSILFNTSRELDEHLGLTFY